MSENNTATKPYLDWATTLVAIVIALLALTEFGRWFSELYFFLLEALFWFAATNLALLLVALVVFALPMVWFA